MLKMNRCILSVQMKNVGFFVCFVFVIKFENPRGFDV